MIAALPIADDPRIWAGAYVLIISSVFLYLEFTLWCQIGVTSEPFIDRVTILIAYSL